MLRLTPAAPSDVLALLAARGDDFVAAWRLRRLWWQIANSEAYAFSLDGERMPLAIAGVVPIGDAGELWFSCAPAIARHMSLFTRHARQVLRRVVVRHPLGVLCLVECGHEPGERLARIMGLRPTGVCIGRSQEWVFARG